jgi:hypothetical protein
MLGFAPAHVAPARLPDPSARLVRDLRDLVLDAQLLALQGRNHHGIRQWSMGFFVDFVLEAGVLGLERLDTVFDGHRKTSVSRCAQY